MVVALIVPSSLEIVIVAIPIFFAVITPFSTVTILSSLEDQIGLFIELSMGSEMVFKLSWLPKYMVWFSFSKEILFIGLDSTVTVHVSSNFVFSLMTLIVVVPIFNAFILPSSTVAIFL